MVAHILRGPVVLFALAIALVSMLPSVAFAQTDYFNTDAGRPIRVEDAYALERQALELQIAPFRVERARAGGYRWGIEPEIAIGLLPRTHIEVGVPILQSGGNGLPRTTAVGGVELSAFYNFNAETRLPAFAIAGEVVIPAGSLGPSTKIPTIKGIATRTLPWARFHVNGQFTFASDPTTAPPSTRADAESNAEYSRWQVGMAVDRSLPLRSMLFTAEVVTSQPLVRAAALRWDVAAGTRIQFSPRVAFDMGGGYRLTGEDPGWFATTGAAVAIGLPWRGN
ncbi:MAG TPA: hypothetical protein DGD08_12625 [Gemmatimonas aurantiaca]|nr:hypothetical protein [Gemmatimonas aurantiaca]